jgi:hypothetical protein
MQRSIVRVIPVVVATVVVLAWGGAARAQPSSSATWEMTIEGMPAKAKANVTIESWSWGASAAEERFESDEAAKSTKPKKDIYSQDFFFVIEQTPTSAMLLESMMQKKVLTKVTVKLRQTGSNNTFELVMKDVKVTSYQTGASSYGGSGPTDQLAMAFKTAKVTIGSKAESHATDVSGNAN